MEATRRPSDWKAPFFAVWTAQAFSLLGSELVQFALVWWLTATTGSATVLATAALTATLPNILLGPLAGACVDRWNRRTVMMAADGVIALATLLAAILAALHLLQPWHIYVVMLIRSVGANFHWPAMQASTSLMVPKQHLARIGGLNQGLRGATSIIAPPMGALLISVVPLQGVLAIDLGTALLAIGTLAFVHIPQPVCAARAPGASQSSIWQDLRAGVRFVLGWRGLYLVGAMAILLNMLLNPAFALLPILVTRYFGGGALQLASLQSAWGIGIVAGGLVLGVWGGFRRRTVTSLIGVLGMGLAFVIVGLTPPSAMGVAAAAIFVAGFMNPIANGPLFATIQAIVAPEMQGRVFMLLGSVAAAATPLGLIIAGPVADAVGVSTWFVVGGLAATLMGILGFLLPEVLYLEDNHTHLTDTSTGAAQG